MQNDSGIYRILSRATVYGRLQRLIGRCDNVSLLVDDYAALQPGESVLDIGCGPGTLVPYLKGNDYFGFDPNADYIETARRTYPTKATFAIGTVDEIATTLTRRFDVAFAIGVVHHLADADADRLLTMAKATLRPGGRLLTYDGVLRRGQNPLAHLLLKLDRGKAVRTIEGYRALAAAHFDRINVHVRNDLLRVPYEHAILVCHV